ncbi:alpha-2-macroglobulin receptor-associated protein [Patella vulgata]|uniref:alpha-2-macroglobulin receptor-associated protein n=1 Tax=Patella vulgata TaxID=6465 RepID=UPI002180594A|nr:alpha-2-macroglobulin receptor-associated protein [Patella vulgata]
MKCLLVFLSITVCLVDHGYSNKYSEESNKNWHEEEIRPFRMNKINLLWEKAKKKLEGNRLADLYADLKLHDKLEGKLKKLKSDDMDKDGLQEADVLVRFRNIVFKYSLQDFFPVEDPAWLNDVPTNDKSWPFFSDKKLEKIWKAASLSDFSEDELDKLRDEFRHQQMKIDELNALKDQVEDINDNTIHNNKNGGNDFPSASDKKTAMKDTNRAIKEGYIRLQNMMEKTKDGVDFKDPRVYQLWALVKKANLSQEEMESFREELRHFEHRIEKHEYMQGQVELSKLGLEDEVKDGRYPQKHLDLEEKAKQYKHKMKKLHIDLQNRVNKVIQRHTEL